MIKKTKPNSMINMDIMYTVFGNNHLAMQTYIREFTITSLQLLKKIEQAIQDNDDKLALDYFHQLKGPAGSSGFNKIYKLCEKAENHIEQCNWEVANKVYIDLEKALRKLQTEMENNFKK